MLTYLLKYLNIFCKCERSVMFHVCAVCMLFQGQSVTFWHSGKFKKNPSISLCNDLIKITEDNFIL